MFRKVGTESQPSPESGIERVSLRLPAGLVADVDAAAAEAGRTRTAEIKVRLERSFSTVTALHKLVAGKGA